MGGRQEGSTRQPGAGFVGEPRARGAPLSTLTHPNLTTGQVSAALVSSCLANLARLGVAHADRVRAGVILKSEQTTDMAQLAIMAGYRNNLLPKCDT
jgi:hypothetical protein